MPRTALVTPAFARAALLKDLLEHLYKTPPSVPHYILVNHYPLPSVAENNAEIKRLAEQYGCIWIDSGEDLGLHRSLNHMVKVTGLEPGDLLVGCDPDDRPSPDFVQRLERVMRADPTIAVAAPVFWVIDERAKDGCLQEEIVAGERVWYHPGVEMFTVAMFNMSLIHDMGGFHQHLAYYGTLECALYEKWRPKGMRLAYLPDVRADAAPVDRDNPELFDAKYREWKTAHVGGFKGSLADYLQMSNGRLVESPTEMGAEPKH